MGTTLSNILPSKNKRTSVIWQIIRASLTILINSISLASQSSVLTNLSLFKIQQMEKGLGWNSETELKSSLFSTSYVKWGQWYIFLRYNSNWACIWGYLNTQSIHFRVLLLPRLFFTMILCSVSSTSVCSYNCQGDVLPTLADMLLSRMVPKWY